ncbi:hypothetical protein FGADI_11505 [Fusarium gaditjirri]|uniref:Heterokaryon incompatibility domain-containing protein n=1 Tax=Fusarium gaditjirri TaxID=282569 RepID=A0A8H4SUZ0_9HYPO|nr:hypothetical protein FGADI_11505 [Fusarium gaditjirri]
MSPGFCYSMLPEGHIRLLRLMPHENHHAPIQCQLFNHALVSSGGTHLYEALSYTWGNPDACCSISINNFDFAIATNLYDALLHLRDRSIDRVIWIDALCINQRDEEEKSRQVQSMAQVYAKAYLVVVWLGLGTDESDEAFEVIRKAAAKEPIQSSANIEEVQSLLQRQWFQRIWVLQEVAAARHILIKCGRVEIDGYTFCSGLNDLKISYKSCPDLASLIPPVTYLMREAIFRPKVAISRPARFSLDVKSLGELVDMYHTRAATDRRDKIYALLGMSSDDRLDDPAVDGILPDYRLSWKQVFQQLVRFLFSKDIIVETCDNSQEALIITKGHILGEVSSVHIDGTWSDRQTVKVNLKNVTLFLQKNNKKRVCTWTLQKLGKSIEKGDVVCLLQGASKATIIRLHEDHCTIIAVAVTVTDTGASGEYALWQKHFKSVTSFPRDFLLVWDLGDTYGVKGGDNDATRNNSARNCTVAELETHMDKGTRLWNVGLALGDLGRHQEEEKSLLEAIEVRKQTAGKDHPRTLSAMEGLASIYRETEKWEKAEHLYLQVIQVRKTVQASNHPDTLNSMAQLASTYRRQRMSEPTGFLQLRTIKPDPDKAEKLEAMIDILNPQHIQYTKERTAQVAARFDREVMGLLLDERGNEVHITEDIVTSATSNGRHGKEVMRVLLDRRGNEFQITDTVIEATAQNTGSGAEVMKVLLKQREDEVRITELVVKAAAGNKISGKVIMMLLINYHRGKQRLEMTERAINQIIECFEEAVVEELLYQRAKEIQITEASVDAARRNVDSCVLYAITQGKRKLDERVRFTESAIIALLKDEDSGDSFLQGLVRAEGNEFQISERILIEVGRHCVAETMGLLIERGVKTEVFTKEVIKAAASNPAYDAGDLRWLKSCRPRRGLFGLRSS